MTLDDLKNAETEDMVANLAYLVSALVRTASAALEADPGRNGWPTRNGDVRQVLDLAAELTDPLIDGAEGLERLASRGVFRHKMERAA